MSQDRGRSRPTGWANFHQLGVGKHHFFAEDGRSLCGKWVNPTRNILLRGDAVHPDERCAACKRKAAKAASTKRKGDVS